MEKTLVIITAYEPFPLFQGITIPEDATIICADGGYDHAMKHHIVPSKLIGDLDSLAMPVPKEVCVEKLPREKDDTDTFFCVKQGIEQGYTNILILGGVGGRLDHTIANLQILAYGVEKGVSIAISSPEAYLFMQGPGRVTVKNNARYFSLFSYTEACTGVTIKHAKYPLSDATLTHSVPVGVSNEFTEKDAEISCETGMLLIMLTQEI